MTEKLQQTIKEEVMKLPKEMQDAINSLDWAGIAGKIAENHLLDESSINDFQVETLLALVGLTDMGFYDTYIENNVGTTKDEAKEMAEEAFEKIFTPINNKLAENIKKGGKNKNPNWEKNLNFILSGGDYSVFIAPTSDQRIEPPINPPTLQDIKNKLAV